MPRLALLVTTAVACLSLLAIIHSSLKLEPQGCRMSMMAPVYIKLSGFDTEHSRFASKYSLYLYREAGVDAYSEDDVGLGGGVPVLFIPGNAGSYKQVRSLSSEASRYYHDHLRHDHAAKQNGLSSLDFFTVDFNEDLAAFHGQTVIDQAEYVNEAVAYILSLYSDPGRSRRDPRLPDPSSVILIGHSMGGIVARTVLVMPNYQANSINTIITMSTPHARPPVSFDADIVALYQQVNDYWRESYTQRWASNNPLWHTTLISIAGGARDTTVPSDYASLASLVPESHGFTVFTSTIPDVWTPMDHLAITWADQLRKVVVKSLFDIIDVRRAAQTKQRAERIKIFRKWFLTGLEENAPKNLFTREPELLLTLGSSSRSAIMQTERVVLRTLGAQDEATATLLPIPVSNTTQQRLSILTDQAMEKDGSFERLEILFCSTFPLHGAQASALLPTQIDLSDGGLQATRLACKKAAGDAIRLPASTRASHYAFEETSPFTYLQYNVQDLQEHQFLAIVDKSTEISNGWLIAEIANAASSVIDVPYGTEKLLMTGVEVDLPASRPLLTEIRIPAMQSSLLAYNMKLRSHGCSDDMELFTPLLRQYVERPYESKYFVNFKQGDISLHGSAPFMPPALNKGKSSSGVAFQIWSDPTCDSSLEVELKANFLDSLGMLVIRYRTVFAAFPLLVVAMVLRKQFRVYDSTGVFITFSDGLDQSLRLALPVLFLSMTFFATAFSTAGAMGQESGSRFAMNGTSINYSANDLLLGSQDSFFWFLVPLVGLLSVGVCAVVNYLVLAIICALSFALRLFAKPQPKTDDTKRAPTPVFTASSTRRRIINTSVLLVLVATIIPYPFAYLVACIVQLVTCTRALRYSTDFFNYTYSILLLMLWGLPINLPTLVVWVHNLAVHWGTPFSSHHNVLSIMPFILLVETLASGKMVPRQRVRVARRPDSSPVVQEGAGRFSGMLERHMGTSQAEAVCFFFRWATNILFFVLAVYAAFYGMTYAYRLHYIANVIALWLFILHLDGTSHGEIKKMP